MPLPSFFIDRGEKLNVNSKKPFRSQQGHLRVDGIVTAAKVLRYFIDGEYANVLRHPDDVFNPHSLETLSGIPITVDHPVNENGVPILVTPQNWKNFGVGTVGDEIEIINPYVKINGLNIQDESALDTATKGHGQLSPGYLTNRVKDNGIWEGIPYQYRQVGCTYKNSYNNIYPDESIIRYNHLAIVPANKKGRTGENVRLLLGDSEESLEVLYSVDYDCQKEDGSKQIYINRNNKTDEKNSNNHTDIDQSKRKTKMSKMILINAGSNSFTYAVDTDTNTVTIDVSDIEAIRKVIDEHSTVVQKVNEILDRIEVKSIDEIPPIFDAKDAEIKALKTQIAKLEADSVDESEIQRRVNQILEERDRRAEAKQIVGDSINLDGLSDREIKILIIKKWDKDIINENSSDVEIDTIYPIAKKYLQINQDKAINDAKEIVNAVVNDGDMQKRTSVIKPHLNRGVRK